MAYHVVSSATGAGGATQTTKKKTEWPDALKLYVGKAFENVEDADRPKLELHLKAMITLAFESNSVWTTDWAQEPLPVLARPTSFMETWTSLQPDSPTMSAGSFDSGQGSGPAIAPTKRKKSRFDVSSSVAGGVTSDSDAQKAKRSKRFEDLSLKTARPASPVSIPMGYSEGVPDYDEHTIIGHATKLEKSYLRLTSAPDPDSVRPLHVLKDTLDLLKRKWKEDANYAYICDQFKSLRQDLTVQRIKNDFTINVYEIHARIALEKSDLGEYNQCQTQLQNLYHQMPGIGHPLEFLSYRILYMLHTRNLTEINTVLVNLTPLLRIDPSIAHALSVRKAMACNNYPRLFKLYLEAPNMSGYLMDNFIDRERISALSTICRSYRPTFQLDESSAKLLGFGATVEFCDFLTSLDDETVTASITQTALGLASEGVAMVTQSQHTFSMDTKKAGDYFDLRQRTMGGVDIKGQI